MGISFLEEHLVYKMISHCTCVCQSALLLLHSNMRLLLCDYSPTLQLNWAQGLQGPCKKCHRICHQQHLGWAISISACVCVSLSVLVWITLTRKIRFENWLQVGGCVFSHFIMPMGSPMSNRWKPCESHMDGSDAVLLNTVELQTYVPHFVWQGAAMWWNNTFNITTPETSQRQKLCKLWNLQNFAAPCNPTATNKPFADAQAWSHQLTWNSGLPLGSPHLEELNGQLLHLGLRALEAIIIILFHIRPSCSLCVTQTLIFWGQLVEDPLQTSPEEFGICWACAITCSKDRFLWHIIFFWHWLSCWGIRSEGLHSLSPAAPSPWLESSTVPAAAPPPEVLSTLSNSQNARKETSIPPATSGSSVCSSMGVASSDTSGTPSTSATPETSDTSESAPASASPETSGSSSGSNFGSTSMVVASSAAAGTGILGLPRCPLAAGRFLGASLTSLGAFRFGATPGCAALSPWSALPVSLAPALALALDLALAIGTLAFSTVGAPLASLATPSLATLQGDVLVGVTLLCSSSFCLTGVIMPSSNDLKEWGEGGKEQIHASNIQWPLKQVQTWVYSASVLGIGPWTLQFQILLGCWVICAGIAGALWLWRHCPKHCRNANEERCKKTSQLTIVAKTAENVARRFMSGQKVLHWRLEKVIRRSNAHRKFWSWMAWRGYIQKALGWIFICWLEPFHTLSFTLQRISRSCVYPEFCGNHKHSRYPTTPNTTCSLSSAGIIRKCIWGL